jgi:anthranilate phosphoribosyltransferase
MSIAAYLKEIGRGRDGARALARAEAADLFGRVLDRSVGELEIGAFCLAMRVKGETPDEMAGFLDATEARVAAWPASADPARPLVVLPSYNGARRLPVLTPLLALLLARRGHPVLLHGMRTEGRRVTAPEVLESMGIAALAAPRPVAPGEVAHLATATLHGGLASLLATRERLGVRNPAHGVVKLLAPAGAVLVTGYTHADAFATMRDAALARGLAVLLSRGLEGEPAADPRRTPRYDALRAGTHRVLQEQQAGTLDAVAGGLPDAIDAASTAAWTVRVLAGDAPVPEGIARQVDLVDAFAREREPA